MPEQIKTGQTVAASGQPQIVTVPSDGEYFWLGAGGTAKLIFQRQGDKLVRVTPPWEDFVPREKNGDLDFQGKLISFYQGKANRAALTDLRNAGIDPDSIISNSWLSKDDGGDGLELLTPIERGEIKLSFGSPSSVADSITFQQSASPSGDLSTAGGKTQPTGETPGAGGFVEGKAYKNPNNADIFLFKNGKFNWIQDEATFKQIFGGLPEEGTNFTTLDSVEGIEFGPSLNEGNVQGFISTGQIPGAGATPGAPGAPQDNNTLQVLDEEIDLSGLDPEAKLYVQTILDQLEALVAKGEQINPDIDISDEQLLQFLDEAKADLAPFFDQIFQESRKDLLLNLQSLKAETELGLGQQERAFDRGLRDIREEAGETGLTFSGRKARAEQELRSGTNENLATLRRRSNELFSQTSRTAERELGSEALTGFKAPQGINFATAGPEGLQFGGTEDLFKLSGGLTGRLERERETAELQKRNQKAKAFKSGQALDFI